MRSSHYLLAAGVLVALGLVTSGASAQQTTVGTPYRVNNDSFFEQNAINWSGNYRGFNFAMGNSGLAQPAFGGFNANAGINTNFSIANRNGQINFGLSFGQGYKATSSTEVPTLTLMNGQVGYVSDTSQTPFVISVVPVVGAFPTVNEFRTLPLPAQLAESAGVPLPVGNPLVNAMRQEKAGANAARGLPELPPQAPGPGAAPGAAPQPQKQAAQQDLNLVNVPADPAPDAPGARVTAAQSSSAGRAAPSVAEARRMHDVEQGAGDEELAALMERGRAAEEDGKPNVAKIYYQRVARHATGELKQQAQARIEAIRGTASR